MASPPDVPALLRALRAAGLQESAASLAREAGERGLLAGDDSPPAGGEARRDGPATPPPGAWAGDVGGAVPPPRRCREREGWEEGGWSLGDGPTRPEVGAPFPTFPHHHPAHHRSTDAPGFSHPRRRSLDGPPGMAGSSSPSPSLSPSPPPGVAHNAAPPLLPAADDEYENDDDPGYVREPAEDQEPALAAELARAGSAPRDEGAVAHELYRAAQAAASAGHIAGSVFSDGGASSPPSRESGRWRGDGGGSGAATPVRRGEVRLAAPVLSSSSLSALAGSPGRLSGLPRPPSSGALAPRPAAAAADAALRRRSMDAALAPTLGLWPASLDRASPPPRGASPPAVPRPPPPRSPPPPAAADPASPTLAQLVTDVPPAGAARAPGFSFPVTPPPGAGPAPAAVFGSWTSLRRNKSVASSAWSLDAPSAGDSDGESGGERGGARGGPARAGRRFAVGSARWAPAPRSPRSATDGEGGPGSACGAFRSPAPPPALCRASPPPPPPSRFDAAAFADRYDEMALRVVALKQSAGPERGRGLALAPNELVAGRYVILARLAPSASSTALQALDTKTGSLVCLKSVKGGGGGLDAGLDEARALRAVAAADPSSTSGVVRLLDFFYYREHFFLVTELLRANLHQVGAAARARGSPYFTPDRARSVARQLLRSLSFMHSLRMIHGDVKPENVLLKSHAACEVALIDLGSVTYAGDPPSAYIQSRAYRAPEVVLGLPYDGRIDVWSVGCVVAELVSGRVLFHADSAAGLLARVAGILGPPPPWMRARGRAAPRFYTPSGALYERSPRSGRAALLRPKRTTLAARVPGADAGALAFLAGVLVVDAALRPTAEEALGHPWLAEGGGGGGGAAAPPAPASPAWGARGGGGFVVVA